MVFQGQVGTLRLNQQLNGDWRWQTTSHGYQRLVTQDRIAFPVWLLRREQLRRLLL